MFTFLILLFEIVAVVDCYSLPLPNGDASTATPGGLRKVVSDWIAGAAAKDTVIANYGSIEDWDVSGVTQMAFVFYDFRTFNADVSKWNVAAVTNMESTFQDASVFNGDLSKWNVAAVKDMRSTFYSASVFNGDLSKWNVTAVTSMYRTFYNAKAFNFKHALDIEWEAKNPSYPGDRMYDLTCSSDSACGNCGKKSTAGSAVTCSSSVQPAKDATTVCTFCADDYNECCTTPTCDNIDGSSTPFAASSCLYSQSLKNDLSAVSCATTVCVASDCCTTPVDDTTEKLQIIEGIIQTALQNAYALLEQC